MDMLQVQDSRVLKLQFSSKNTLVPENNHKIHGYAASTKF